MIDWYMQGKVDVGFDSNVDDAYPEEEDPFREKSDFYWMPGLTLRSAPWVMAPRTTYNIDAAVAYQDYFSRNDLDSELYNARLTFQTAHPRLTLGGMAGTDYSADSNPESYVPGGVGRDPTLTYMANAFANLRYRALQLDAGASYDSERHDLEKYWDADQDETIFYAAAQFKPFTKLALDASWTETITLLTFSGVEEDEARYQAGATLNLFSWGGVFFNWERTVTTLSTTDFVDEDTESSFGLTGAIPLELLRHPEITYSLGVQYEEETLNNGEVVKTWEPVHTITVRDDLQISKTVQLMGSATWKSEVDTDEISFLYDLLINQQLTPNILHGLKFVQEPEPVLGATSDAKTTTFAYNFNWKDLIFKNLSMSFGAAYEENTPLEVENAETEETTTLAFGLRHTRPLTRKLNRIITYQFTQESSNFHHDGPKQEHLAIYGFTYDF